MNMKSLTVAAMVAVATTMTGCVAVPGPIIDKTKPVDQGKYTVVSKETVSSSVYHLNILGFIPIPPIFTDSNSASEMGENMIASASGQLLYRKALAKAPGADALIEYSLDHQYCFFPLLMFTRTTLTGVPVKTAK